MRTVPLPLAPPCRRSSPNQRSRRRRSRDPAVHDHPRLHEDLGRTAPAPAASSALPPSSKPGIQSSLPVVVLNIAHDPGDDLVRRIPITDASNAATASCFPCRPPAPPPSPATASPRPRATGSACLPDLFRPLLLLSGSRASLAAPASAPVPFGTPVGPGREGDSGVDGRQRPQLSSREALRLR